MLFDYSRVDYSASSCRFFPLLLRTISASFTHPQLNMLLSQLFILSMFMFIHQVIISATNIDGNVAISCGASGDFPAPDGRVWVGDASFSSSLLQLRGKSIKSRVPHQFAGLSDPVPYKSARTSRHGFTYQFSVKPGQKFIRLHFKPASYKGFKKSKAIFTVKTGQHTLLSDFIPTLAADALGINYFKKEFCITVQESETLSITFIPSRFLEDTYAFVNAIEIVSMPAGLYFTPDGNQGVRVVGRKHRFYIDNSTALETIQRINVGGNSISSLEDATMFRDWEDDSNYLIEVGAFSINSAVPIRFTSSATQSAPKEVYQTARSVGAHCHSNVCNLTWNIPLDLGFRYLVRLHFCEIEPAMTNKGERNFTIVINNHNAEDEADVIKWSGGHGISVYRDYVAIMEGDRREGKHKLSIVLQPKLATISNQSNAILNGLEVFKISNPDNNLGSVSPAHPVTTSTPEQFVSFTTKNKIATVLTLIVTLINVVVYYITCNSEINSGKMNNRISCGEHQCRQFSLDEMVRSTNNFDPQLVIGSGGYGTVYKGDIDGGETTVAVKRLKSGSSQGQNEFWTEIKMLSTHRHENLLSLIGYCNEGPEMLLVYDYMSRGSLADHLFKKDTSSSSLSWEQRLKIAIGAARGLDFLHTSQNRVIHRDVKSSNILLDENWVSKISDFGLSKMGPGNESATHVSTQVKGTFGYLDPEYFLTNRLTWKTDVYAFGVVLFEVLSGRPAVNLKLPEEQHGLVAWAKQCIKEREVSKLIDQNLAGSISSTCLKVFVGISVECFNGHPHQRPGMSEVVKSLELALVSQQNAGEDIISFDDTSTSQLKVEAKRASIKEDCNGVDIAERSAISRTKVKSEDKSLYIASPRWWDFFGLFRKAPPKPWNLVHPNSQILPHPNLRMFSFAELKAATRKFNNDTVLGDGGFGKVYKGWLDERASSKSGRTVIAVKKLNSESLQGFEEFQSEVSFLGRLSHPNLVKLLGYCQEDKELLLVYEFMQKGSLANHLFGRRSAALSLPWNVRLKIMIGAARGLAFLHASEKQVIYRNIKASNILLDGSYNAKIADFGMAKLGPSATQSHVSTRVMGTYGYAAPEYVATGHLYVKSDVYGFGVFLLEMLTGLQAADSNRPSNQHNLVEWIKPHLSDRRKLKDKIDSRLGGKYPSRAAVQIAQLALSCLENEPKTRPSMKEVVEKLEHIEAANERLNKEPRISSKHQTAEYGQQPLHHPSPYNPRHDVNRAYPLPRRAE
ncbi:receptor-like protein kinase FERONIA [Lycium barbarum]|uniref:receptor-like protein kinase FERONIA n=1 Tax=Lycium barbarum TaxID=112863 RepID=UPI00293F02F3|nr:receptor-like protein kinase FERONIA [Lycium barbarum]